MDNIDYITITCKRCDKEMEIPLKEFLDIQEGNTLICGGCLQYEALQYINRDKYERLQKATY